MIKEIKRLTRFNEHPRLLVVLASFVVILFSVLNALVDKLLHPEIPMLDMEHIYVGGATGLVTAVLAGALLSYFRRLSAAVSRIRELEDLLSICAVCKKIRVPDSDPERVESWQPVEVYISRTTATRFSHGICPTCLAAYEEADGLASPAPSRSDPPRSGAAPLS